MVARISLPLSELTFLTLIPLCCFVLLVGYPLNVPLLTNDSPSYMFFGNDRPVGYPIFLWVMRHCFGSYWSVPTVQAALLCLALGSVAVCFRIVVGAFWETLVLEIVLFCNPGLLLLSRQIGSDCLSAIFIAVFSCIVLTFLRKKSAAQLIGLIVIAACSYTVKPVNCALAVAALTAIIMFGGPGVLSRVLMTGLLAVLVILAQMSAPFVHHLQGNDYAVGSPLARGLLNKTLFRQWPVDEDSARCEGRLIAAYTAEADAYLDRIPTELRSHLLEGFGNYLRFKVIVPAIEQKYHFEVESEADPILMCYAMHLIKSEPLYFIQDIMHQCWDFLIYSTYLSEEKHDDIIAYLEVHPPVLPAPVAPTDNNYKMRAQALIDTQQTLNVYPADDINSFVPKARPQIAAYSLGLLQVAAGLIMAACIGIMVLRPLPLRAYRPVTLVIGIMGVAFFGEMLITAAVEIALPRYVYPLWPFICTSLSVAGTAVISTGFRRLTAISVATREDDRRVKS